jgi:hypothetical protein
MSDTHINIRIGLYHFQLTRDFRIRIARNDYHIGYPNGFFKIYEFMGWRP